jgi:hypothetical protein
MKMAGGQIFDTIGLKTINIGSRFIKYAIEAVLIQSL